MLEKVSDGVTQKLSVEANTAGMTALNMKAQAAPFNSDGGEKKQQREFLVPSKATAARGTGG